MISDMRSRLLQFVVIFLLLQCIQGALHHFNTERHQQDTEHVLKNMFDQDTNGLPQLRIRKQNAGGDPESNTNYLAHDEHQYARVSYLGEGSKVNITSIISCVQCVVVAYLTSAYMH